MTIYKWIKKNVIDPPEQKSKATLYWEYLPVYDAIRKDPKLRHLMKNDPGYKWMKAVSLLWWVPIAFLYWCIA